jgi:diguanylate cyclase (GGDEF)-like protein
MSGRILVVDDDPVITRFLAADLQLEGYAVDTLSDSSRTLDRAMATRPDLVLLKASGGGVEVLRRLRAHPPTASMPVILLSDVVGGGDRDLGLAAGADDVISKPFDTLDLVSRVGGTLRRTADVRALSPLTGLPGNHRIDVEIAGRAASGQPYAICHVDLDEFKGFNDAYGFQRGDELLLLLAACLQRAVQRTVGSTPFLGHVGGDDFVIVCAPDQAEVLSRMAQEDFDALAASHHDSADALRGWLEVVDRRGQPRRQPLVSVSIGIASAGEVDRDFRAVIAAANEMKSVAKATPGSFIAVDRRA